MDVDDKEFCQRSIAYIKPNLIEGDGAIRLPDEDTPVLTDKNNGLLISYVVDTGTSYQYVLERQRKNSGLSEDQLSLMALQNLRELENSNEARVIPYEDVYAVLWNGDLEASLIFIDQFWDEDYSSLAPNGFVAAIPARDILSFCDAASEVGIQQLKDIVERANDADHPITNALYLRRPGSNSWELFDN